MKSFDIEIGDYVVYVNNPITEIFKVCLKTSSGRIRGLDKNNCNWNIVGEWRKATLEEIKLNRRID